MRKILFGIFAVILLFVSCNNSPSGQKNGNQNNPDDKLYQIYFESDELTLELGEEKVLSAVVKDKEGNIIEDAIITFSSGKEELLSINENSNAKAKMIGDVVITAAATIDDKEISSNLIVKSYQMH